MNWEFEICIFYFSNRKKSGSMLYFIWSLMFTQCLQVGEDEFGYMLADILKENNVNNEGLRFDPGARTALAFVTLRSDGEREFMFYRNPSADMLLREEELDFDLIRKVCYNCYSWYVRNQINLIVKRLKKEEKKQNIWKFWYTGACIQLVVTIPFTGKWSVSTFWWSCSFFSWCLLVWWAYLTMNETWQVYHKMNTTYIYWGNV